MPIFEHVCADSSCPEYGSVEEHYYPSSECQDPVCVSCGNRKKRLISTFGVVFTGPITSKYNSKESENPNIEGHWQWRTKGVDGQPCKPEPVFIETFQQQKEFAKSEGLTNPKDIGPCEVHSDGRGVSTRGLPGSW